MAAIHKMLKVLRPPIGMEGRIQIHTVVTPSTLSGEICDRHQLHVGHAQFFQVIQVRLGCLECSFGRKGADMQLIDECTRERRRLPAEVTPAERGIVHYSGLAVDAVRLPSRARIGKRRLQAIDHETIIRARACRSHLCRPPAPFPPGQGKSLVSDFDFDGAGSRSPDVKNVHTIPPLWTWLATPLDAAAKKAGQAISAQPRCRRRDSPG